MNKFGKRCKGRKCHSSVTFLTVPFVVPTYPATPPDDVVASTKKDEAAPLDPYLGPTALESISQSVRFGKSQLAHVLSRRADQSAFPALCNDPALQTLAHLEMLSPVGLQSYGESTTFVRM